MPLRRPLFVVVVLLILPALVGGADLPVTYTVEAKPLNAAIAGTNLTFELYTDSACNGPIAHTATIPIENLDLIARIKRFTPKNAPKKPEAAELRTTVTGVAPAGGFYLKVTGTGITPVGTACQAEAAARTADATKNGCLNILDYGGNGDDIAPNDTAFDNAFAALPASGAGCIYFPPGTYRFASAINKAITDYRDIGSLTLRGDGPRVTELHFPNASGGIHLNRTYFRAHVNFFDFSVTTGQAGTATGIDLVSEGVSIPTSAWSTISNVYVGGDDWRTAYFPTKYWSVAVHIKVWSQFNLINVNTMGATPAGAGSGLFIEGNAATGDYGTLYNITQSSFNSHLYGFIYGDWIQGVTFSQCNFNGRSGGNAIIAGSGYTGLLSQLGVYNSQFDYGGSAIVLLTPVFDVELGGNIFSSARSNTNVVDLEASHGFNITGNKFFMYGCDNPQVCPANTYGLVVDGEGFGTIVGNTFADLTNGYRLQPNTGNITAGLNSFLGVGNPWDDAGATNSVGEQGPGVMTGVVP
jgi:hypothetical protein